MKASDVLNAFEEYYDNLRYLPDDSIIFGCDCGCGGDSYDYEEWKAMHDDFEISKNNLKKVLEEIGIEWDL